MKAMPFNYTHVNPAPANVALFTTEPALTRTFPAGLQSGGALHMWDSLGNRAVPAGWYMGWEVQWFDANAMPLPTKGSIQWPLPGYFDFNRSLKMFKWNATMVNCSSGCNATANITVWHDTTVMGKVYFDYYFEKAGNYHLHISYRGAIPRICHPFVHGPSAGVQN
jgi:hypothetical protein